VQNDSPAKKHSKYIKKFYDLQAHPLNWFALGYRNILARYFNLILTKESNVLEVGCGQGYLLSLLKIKDKVGIDFSQTQVDKARINHPEITFFCKSGEDFRSDEKFDYIIISDTVNITSDVQEMFSKLKKVSHCKTRLILNFHSTLWRPIHNLAKLLGVKTEQPQYNWLTVHDINNLLNLAGWEVIKNQARIIFPIYILGIESLLNKILAPMIPWLCLTNFCIARKTGKGKQGSHSVSILIPARNEAGNLENGIRRIPEFGSHQEVIIVEGNSTDNTWEVVQRMGEKFPEKNIKILQQSGIGKGNAVRDGFDIATGDILMILDADFTMPPEELPKYYDVLANGQGDFANGVRLVYPMDEKAMRFLNLCANKLFGMTFSWLLCQSVRDTLCGTKVLFREDYLKIVENRSYFGDFDPFGDFDLLFGADKLNLKITDVPIRYKDRTYGETNISRFQHGILLLRMVFFAAKKLKFV
jgi:SAM-dependent methyltransferase